MYLESKYKGDDGSVAEELLMGVSEIEERARVVDKAVREGYFSLEEALSLYKVSEIEYLAYSLVKNKKEIEAASKQSKLIDALSMVLIVFNDATNTFDPVVRTMMHQLDVITKNSSFRKVKATR